jgi:hypothetical protein
MNRAQALTAIGQVVLDTYKTPRAEVALLRFAKLCEFSDIRPKEIQSHGVSLISDAIARPDALAWYSLTYIGVAQNLHGKILLPVPKLSSSFHALMAHTRKTN